jgi:hypothetical protein
MRDLHVGEPDAVIARCKLEIKRLEARKFGS